MCGIVASLETPLERASNSIKHRGVRQFHMGPIIHRRLPIRDISEDYDQPVRINHKTIAYVGEFFSLPRESHELHYVAENYERHGPKFFHEVQQDGFWSVVEYNEVMNTLTGTVDYLSIKPLYYRTDIAAMASEPYAAVKLGTATHLDQIYLSSCLKFGYCPDPRRTPYEEVKRLCPGETVYLRKGREPKVVLTDPLVPIPVPANTLKKYIAKSVEARVRDSDVPVALLKSSGLDSTIIHHILKGLDKDLNKDLNIISLPESVDHPPESPKPLPLEDQIGIFQEPIDLGSLEQQIYLAQTIHRSSGEHVVLTGDGADELFGGYKRSQHYDSQYSDIFQELVCWHLPRLDRVHMRYLQEIRAPFLSRNIVQAALALPRELRTNKKILRELYKDDFNTNIPKIAMKRKSVNDDPITNRIIMMNAFKLFAKEQGILV